MKTDRELMSRAFHDGKIGAWWRDRNDGGFWAELPDGRIGRIKVSRVADVLAALPEGAMNSGRRRRVNWGERLYVDL